MANITYDLQWRECMTDILDQIEAEDPEDEALRPDAEADFFQHFAWFVYHSVLPDIRHRKISRSPPLNNCAPPTTAAGT
eukprot:COSAG06_NODE_6971_length_2691_cov_2.131173_5_plen_79_part_00